jgi:hypothetical protein
MADAWKENPWRDMPLLDEMVEQIRVDYHMGTRKFPTEVEILLAYINKKLPSPSG